MGNNTFRCPACALVFTADLEGFPMRYCPLCSYTAPEPYQEPADADVTADDEERPLTSEESVRLLSEYLSRELKLSDQ